MNNHIDIMKKITELAETCLEGLEYIKSKLKQGEFDSTMMMFHDSADAFYQMHRSIQPVLEKLPDNNLESMSDSLHDIIELVVSTYEQGNRGKVMEILQFTLVPRYKKWKAELNNTFSPYLTS
ncbi:MAG: hypothetical protein K9L17_03520 [Clostridiales bacterium]|nr:hypothetical protein [Clostridiales bacterium]MCF8021749.1 hypothetical protein [Clostridiales bacterium]